MSLNYERATYLKNLEIILHDTNSWFMQVARRVFYPDLGLQGQSFTKPASFTNWLEEAQKSGAVNTETLKDLAKIYDELGEQADRMINESLKFRQPPVYEEFDKLALYFEEFINRLHRLEKDSLMGESNIDPLTGLRSREVMEKDIAQEMERLSRQGKPFILALVRIDDFDKMPGNVPEQNIQSFIVTVADMIKKCVRTFDDAYWIDNGMFVLSLKQTSIAGGVKALTRMRLEMQEKKVVYTLNGQAKELSVSSCIAEPMPNEDAARILQDLQDDLLKSAHRAGAVLEHYETSALQRFMRDSGA